ncbi:MAG: chemoreceptor glutamine deamidase CheD [Sedimenticola sp.]|nr:chemoreceptor glutamine deamidase CheD [Sedimenticola sp.]
MPAAFDPLQDLHSIGRMEVVTRYWDKKHGCGAAKLKPGDFYVTQSDEIITTVLGSCIAVCMRDSSCGVAGMNHFMLPLSTNGQWGGATDPSSAATRFGNFAMEHLINALLKLGAKKTQLEVKVFGGGQMMAALTGVGESNIHFVHHYLKTEGMPIKREDVGGSNPRKIIYFPKNGRVLLKRLKSLHNNTLIERERAYQDEILSSPIKSEMELF